MHIYQGAPHSIDHRCMEYHYNTCLTYNRMHIYFEQIYIYPPIDHRCMGYCYTKDVSHIAECTYTKPPPPIDHRYMEYH